MVEFSVIKKHFLALLGVCYFFIVVETHNIIFTILTICKYSAVVLIVGQQIFGTFPCCKIETLVH